MNTPQTTSTSPFLTGLVAGVGHGAHGTSENDPERRPQREPRRPMIQVHHRVADALRAAYAAAIRTGAPLTPVWHPHRPRGAARP